LHPVPKKKANEQTQESFRSIFMVSEYILPLNNDLSIDKSLSLAMADDPGFCLAELASTISRGD